MTETDIRSAVLKSLELAVPGADTSTLDPHLDVREQLDMDSMDLLRFARTLHDTLGVDVPDADTGKLVTVDGAVAYLSTRVTPS